MTEKNLTSIYILTTLIGFILIGPTAALAASPATVTLGTAGNFAVLAGSGITDTTPSVVSGDVGLSPTTGAAIGITVTEVTGTIYAVDAAGPAGSIDDPALLTTAKNDLTTAYNDAAGRSATVTYAPIHDLGGATLTPGVYTDSSSFGITGNLTLDGQGNPNAVFIFQAGSTLTTASNSQIILINSAQACNVFWQVGSSATLGTGSIFKGFILANQSITDNGGSTIEGGLLASVDAVTLNNTKLVKATCVTPPPSPAPVLSTSGGSYNAPLPLIDITKIPNPLALPSGPGLVTYTYTVTNVGPVAMHGVWVKDNKCSPVTYVSGDSNNNSLLDTNEAWIYKCSKVISQTTTNTATTHGQANGWDVYDTANATVVVGLPLVPPLIHLVKKPSVFILPIGGGTVTYTYTVTNPGTAPLDNVSVTDNKCSPVTYVSGDSNHNSLLESNEAWIFTCQTNLANTTTNIGTAEGHANGLSVLDFSPATVVVTSPKLPNTGFDPGNENSVPWSIIIPTGVFIALLSFYLAQKKRTL